MLNFIAAELEVRFPLAHLALPKIYQADWTDNSLFFFMDNNDNLCAEHELEKNIFWVWAKNKWVCCPK